MSIFNELKRRNVFRVAATYVVSAWLLIEIGNTLEETLNLPEWADTFVAFLLIIGFPIVVFFSWAYEITPEGIKREKDIDPADTSRSVTASKLNRALFVVMTIALAYFVVDEFYFERMQTPAAGAPETAMVGQAPDPVEAATSDAGKAASVTDESSAPLVPEKSIAVLPFVNMSSDPEQEYFSDGLTEELLNLLAGIQELKVAARTSSFFYKDKVNEIPMKEVARQLEVAHILEGSVRKGGDKIRITAQLIKADDGFHLWSETYDRTLDDVFAIQDEIAAAVVEQLKLTLLGEAVHQRVVDPKSYELSLQARFLFNRRESGDLERAFELFEEALAIDPKNVMALVGISPLYNWLFDPPRLDDAIDVVNQALAVEPDNPDGVARKASFLYRRDGPSDEALNTWERALELGEKSPLVLSMASGLFYSTGEIEKGLEWQRKALANDPLHLVNIGNMASSLLDLGRWQEAEPYVLKIQELAPGSDSAGQFMAFLLLQKGQPAEALRIAESLGDRETTVFTINNKLPLLVRAHHDLGNDAESRAALEKEIAGLNDASPPLRVARLYAYRGETDQAFEWIERALKTHPDLRPSPFLMYEFAGLRDDPRWEQVRQRFPEIKSWDQGRR
jgi:TolB-like protein/Tfp pilus assembly protein PilF